VKARHFIAFGASVLLLILAKGALADGAYQRTEDHKKTFVWNSDPKPDDTATWSGGRDAEGYATGPGTLQWFRRDRSFTTGSNIFVPKRTLISSYSGTMVHGKFSGSVMTVDHGKTYHATFVDGHKNGRWTAGPVITKAESVEPAAAAEKPERAASATSTEVASESSKTEKISEEKRQPRVAEETSADIPAEGPEEENVQRSTSNAQRPTTEEVNASAPKKAQRVSEPLIAQTASEEPDQSATPRAPVTRKAALAPGAVRAIEHPTHAVAKKSEAEQARRSERAKHEQTEKPSKIAKAASSQPSKAETQLSEDIPAEGPLPAEAEKAQSPSSKFAIAESARPPTLNSQPASKETPVDDSLRTLTGPPSSLHVKTPPETNPPAQISTPPIVAASPPTAGPKLTAVQAMDIADIEARTKGYDLGEYQLPKAEYNAANDTWSVAYVARDADKAAKKLSVTIQDKTGKAEVKK
jgi:hypothetical protein